MNKLQKHGSELKSRTAGYLAAALGLVAGLAWNDAVTSLIAHLFPASRDTVFAKFAYALVLTAVAVFVTVYLLRFLRGGKERE